MSDLLFSLRTEDPVAEGQNPLTWTTRTNLTSVTVRENTLYIMCRHYVISVISFKITVFSLLLRSAYGKRLPLFLYDVLSGGLSVHACYKFLYFYILENERQIQHTGHCLSSFNDSPLSFGSKSSLLQHEERVCC